jgi:general secretion pathway protein H
MRAEAERQAGFTLVEALLAVGLVALLAAVATPLLRGPPPRVQVAAEAARLAAALRVTRSAAMAQSRPLDFVISPHSRSYASPVVPATRLRETTEVHAQLAPATGAVRFYPSGRSSGGAIRLRSGAAEAAIRINWATGHVSLLR